MRTSENVAPPGFCVHHVASNDWGDSATSKTVRELGISLRRMRKDTLFQFVPNNLKQWGSRSHVPPW